MVVVVFHRAHILVCTGGGGRCQGQTDGYPAAVKGSACSSISHGVKSSTVLGYEPDPSTCPPHSLEIPRRKVTRARVGRGETHPG